MRVVAEPLSETARRTTITLGLAGALPFVAVATALWLAPITEQPFLVQALLGYGAVILSFLGGSHWGRMLVTGSGGTTGLIAAVIPSLAGWLALLLPLGFDFATLVAAFLLVLALEQRVPAARWYRRLRLILTAIVCASLLAGWLPLALG
ncbi:MAG: DUF3429 domain-containing protein [Ectothiorhodospiraceae bacterium]